MPWILKLIFISCLFALPAAAQPPLVVEIITAQSVDDTENRSLTGEIAARDTLAASFTSSGRITEVLVQEGDRVTKGTPLARMESVQQEQALRAAQAGLSTADADHRQAIEDLQRQEALLKRGATTRIQRDTAQDALNIAEGARTQASATLDRAQKALSDMVLLAPEAATVIGRLAEPGQVAGATQSMFELALGSQIDALFQVPEILMTAKTANPVLSLTLLDSPDVVFTGMVREISPLVDPATGTVQVKVSITDPPPSVSYGDPVRGTNAITSGQHIIVPFEAMTATTQGPAVWVVDPQTRAVATRQIAIERYETDKVVVSSGLEDGMLVVTRGAQLLFPGRVVQHMEADQ
ncbi:MAG: efflux RND transporter periplasmic adaptor subunit [Sulfitobacter sp.]